MRFSRSLLTVVVCFGVPSAYAGQEPVYRIGQDVIAPRLEREVKPDYTPSAMTAAVQGIVKLECVVRSDGTVGDIRVTESLHSELDAAAVRALEQWRFQPGTKNGEAVAVRIDVEISFALRNAPVQRRGPPLDSPEVYKKADGVVVPVLDKEVKPSYTARAMRDGAQGSVKIECVVLSDGTVGDVRVSQPLHPDLDAESVRVLRLWTFKPGTKDGVAVPVRVEVEMTYTLRSGPRKLVHER